MMWKRWWSAIPVLAVVAAVLPHESLAQPAITARAGIIVDADTGGVIWEQDADRPLPPASTTKVMTAVLALQSHRLDEQFDVSGRAAATPPSKIGFRPGQRVALRDLLYAVLLKSANDAAVVVAEGVSGSELAFAEQMNLKARVAGATTTNFVNPHGLTEGGHLATARDLSRIFRYGLGVPGFREVLRTSSADIFIEGPSARLTTVRSHNRLLNAPDYQVIGKTGYTRAARRCFVGAAGWGPREVVIAILGSTDLWGDARRMLDYAMSPGRPVPVLTAARTPPPAPAPYLRAAPTPIEVARAAPPPPPPPVERVTVIQAPPAPEPRPVEVARADNTLAPQAAQERAARMERALADDDLADAPASADDDGYARRDFADPARSLAPQPYAAAPEPADELAGRPDEEAAEPPPARTALKPARAPQVESRKATAGARGPARPEPRAGATASEARTARASATKPGSARDAADERRRAAAAKSMPADRRIASTTRPGAKEAPPARPAKGTATSRRPGPEGADAKGRYTVQVGPFRDRRQVANARADLAKRGYEAKVVGQKLELGTFSERSRADKLASQLRVKGHRATSAVAR